jgi:hypothetical protein
MAQRRRSVVTVPRVANKDVRHLLVQAERQGFEVRISNGGHVRIRAPSGALIFDTTTRLDPRGFRNFRARMRRAGFAG